MRVFHLLSEHELFSASNGGALSRWVGNIARLDDSIVVTSAADGTWDIPAERLLLMPRLSEYRRFRHYFGSRRLWAVRKMLIRSYCSPLIERLQSGDLVWVHNRPESAAAIVPLVRKSGASLVLHLHNSHLKYATPTMEQELAGTPMVYVSKYLQKEAEGLSSTWANNTVLYNGADGSLFRPKKPLESDSAAGRRLRVLFVGRLVPEKGAHVLVDALKRLAARGVPVSGIIVGAETFQNGADSPYVRQLKADAAANTEFRGHLSGQALIDEFQAADVFCVPSVWDEPLGMSTLEAMASGLPVIAARSGGIPEALQYGGGVIVEKGSVEAIEAAVENFAHDPALRLATARQALDSFEKHFTWPIIHRDFQSIVDRVMHAELKGVS